MYYLLLIGATLALGLGTQAYINAQYRRYSQVALATGQTGAEVARRMLDDEGLRDVGIEMIGGRLSDHYDPRARVLRLSEGVYSGRTVAAAGVAAHEAGHAVQHARAFLPATARQILVPAGSLGSQMAFPLVFIGVLINFTGLITLGIALYAVAVLFSVVTLPVELDASRRAVTALETRGMLPDEQVAGARKVLTAAALTYVAAALIAVLNLLYLLGIGRRD